MYKQAWLITIDKPGQANTWCPMTNKHGKVCGKLLMAMQKGNRFCHMYFTQT